MKTCKNCANRIKDVCALSGYHWRAERMLKGVCNADFGGWEEKESFLNRFIKKIYKK